MVHFGPQLADKAVIHSTLPRDLAIRPTAPRQVRPVIAVPHFAR
ncbi:hypothetical protein USDA257_c43410 [Sinorhizobium fredii USDA 257]|uniref:Uncharacterized protein n=1 Tax=Sinorhizobium fredii (strain USDA 257) TaxID=1185652 RepID=I3XAH4_SINF2|nr:hypothetical protein USDA257_c43410 [Sinorhizobium fredii USDA 257]